MKKQFVYLLTILAVLSALCFSYTSFNSHSDVNDSVEYQQLAYNLSHHNLHYAGDRSQALDYRLFTKRPAFYSAFINLSSLENLWLLRLVQTLCFLVLFVLGLQLLKSMDFTRVSLIYSLLYLSSVPLLFGAQFALADLILSILIACLLILFVSGGGIKTRWKIAIIWSLALLCKPVIMPSIVLLVLLLIIRFRNWYPLLLSVAIFIGIVVHNQQLTGTYHMSSISTINRSYYNAKLLIASVYGLDSADAYTRDSIFKTPVDEVSFKEYKVQLDSRSNQTITSHLGPYFKIHVLGMLKALVDPGRFEIYTYFNVSTKDGSLTELIYAGDFNGVWTKLKEKPRLIGLFMVLLLIKLMALVGLIFAMIKLKKAHLILWFALAYFLVLSGPLGAFRFLVPAFIAYLALSCWGLSQLILTFKKSSEG